MRVSKLTEKDMQVTAEMDATKVQAKKTKGTLKDYSLRHNVEMRWDLNEDAIRDQMFILKIDDYEVILDWEEVQRYGRWI